MEYYRDEIERYSNQYGLEANLVRAIIKQESGWNPLAMRFEPKWGYFYELAGHAAYNKITEATEEHLQMFSWGLGQLMGTVIRELGFIQPLVTFLTPEIQICYICKYLEKIKNKTTTTEEIFACYNGGGGSLLKKKDGVFPNQKYVDSAMGHLEYYRSYYGR